MEQTEEQVIELSVEVLEAMFTRTLILGQVLGELSEEPTRDDTVAFAARHVGKIWDDYQVFKAEQVANADITEATIVKEEPQDA
jgi:hypothetical protein